jgi:hypothetical protein
LIFALSASGIMNRAASGSSDDLRSQETTGIPPVADSAALIVIVDDGPYVTLYTPELRRARTMRMNDSMEIRISPMDIGILPRKNPGHVPDCGPHPTCRCLSQRASALFIFVPRWSNEFLADCNDDLVVDTADLSYLLDHLYRGGPPPNPDWEYTNAPRSDFNFDGDIDIRDFVMTAWYLHRFANPQVPVIPDTLREELRRDSLELDQ